MKSRYLGGLLVVVSLCSCSKWQEHSFQKNAENYLREHLRDPSSAEFKDTKVLWRKDKELILCGRLNAKNGMGGFTGFTPFIVIGQVDGLGTKDYDAIVANPVSITDEQKAQDEAFREFYEGNCGDPPTF